MSSKCVCEEWNLSSTDVSPAGQIAIGIQPANSRQWRETGRCESSAWSVSLSEQTDASLFSFWFTDLNTQAHILSLSSRVFPSYADTLFAQEVHEDVIRCWYWQDYTDLLYPVPFRCEGVILSSFSLCLIISSSGKKCGACASNMQSIYRGVYEHVCWCIRQHYYDGTGGSREGVRVSEWHAFDQPLFSCSCSTDIQCRR